MSVTSSPPSASSTARTVVLEATAPQAVDWAAARIFRVIVTVHGRPCAAFWTPSPGHLRDPERFTRALLEPGRTLADYERSYEHFRARMGMDRRPAWPRPTCTVIVCTHRRSAYLPGLLDAVRRLDPQPDEVIVVDNDPGAEDSREVIEAAGATYVREDRRGLDHARTAGLRAASGELVAFTDDDCVPAVRWLADLGELFAPPAVAAVTGPAFAWELESPAQLRFELEGGFSRGLRRRRFDWTVLSPLDAGAVGAGANMIFRRSVLAALGDPFPGELDAGTKTQSGGDMYALYRLLAAGHRVVYDPGTYVFHRHRRDPASLHHAFWGYGVGLSAVMAKLLVEERELDAVSSWMWLWRQYRAVQLRRLAGKAEPRQVRVAWDYLRGGFSGAGAWWTARRELGPAPAGDPRREPAAPEQPPPGAPRRRPAAAPALSVVVPTAGRLDALARCLAALEPQRAHGEVEIVVVDDGVPPATAVPGDPDQIVRSGGRGAAAARNAGAEAARGRLLLFLDDDLVPAPDLVARHRERHEERPRAVVGYCPPGPPDAGLAEQAAALWWHDHFELMADSARPTFTSVLSGNLSLPRRTFLELGGFDEEVGRLRREDWLFGLVALDSGLELTYAPDAVAVHEFRLPVRRRLRAAYAEGRGDALLIARRPELERLLLPPARRGWRPASLAVRGWAPVAARPRAIAAAGAALDLLERGRMRRRWLRGFQVAQTASYIAGRRAARPPATRDAPRTKLPVVVAESDAPLPVPRAFAPPFGLIAGDRRPDVVVPDHGCWDRSVAHTAAGIVIRAEQRRAPEPRSQAVSADSLPLLAFGPAHTRGEDILVRDSELRVVHAAGEQHWEAIDAAVRAASDPYVIVPMPRVVPTLPWCEAVAERLDGDRVAVVFGVNVRPPSVGGAPLMRARFADPERYPTLDGPFLFLALQRERFLELGGFRAGLDRFGPYAAPLELAERALDAGLVVAHERVPGAGVMARGRGLGDRREWSRQRARGALGARDALALGGLAAPLHAVRGAAPLANDALRRHYPPHVAAGRLLAYAAGALEAGAAARRR